MKDPFSSAILSENARGLVAVIPDIKCFSPQDGNLLDIHCAAEAAQKMVNRGAPLLSVVTESEHFGGSPELLRSITHTVDVPVLRKDFVTNVDMLKETVELGAAAVLLICAVNEEKKLATLFQKAMDLGLEPLVEIHTLEEMQLAKKLGARLIGINNRNIRVYEQDGSGPERTVDLAFSAPKDSIIVSESGILSPTDAQRVAAVGVNALIVGTALWQARDPEMLYQSLRVRRSTLCNRW